MKRTLLIILLSLFTVMVSFAQGSMTDDQVLKFIVKEHTSGTSQSQIVSKLIQKGVNIQQIRRVRDKYQKQMKGNTLGSTSGSATTESDDDMLRVSNGKSARKSSAAANKGDKAAAMAAAKGSGTMVEGMDAQEAMPKSMKRKLKKQNTGEDDMDDDDKMTEDEKALLFNGRKVFGRDIFNNEELSFEPAMNIATPQNYTVGPGDKVKVDIYGASQKSDVYTVSPDGDITIEGFGPITIGGLTVSQAQSRLRSSLGSRYSSSSIKMTLGQTRTITINVMGEVRYPGTYSLSAFASVFHALYMAGGISEIGTLRNIKVYRNGKHLANVDIYDFILNGKLSGSVRLADNDVIVVGPYDSMVDIQGKVKRPMYYEMKKNESLGTLLKYAGGYASDAYTKSARVIRKSGSNYSVFNVGEFDMNSFHIADGDSVSIDSILPRFENMVELRGAVFRPGMYQIGGDVTTVKDLLTFADGIKEEALPEHAVMHRMKPNRTLEALSINVKGIMDGTVADIPLRNEDVLFIPSTEERMKEQTLKIYGEVYYPGTYKYAEGLTVEDFILQAGGLKESAATNKVIVTRRILGKDASSTGTLTENHEITLKEGFALDGKAGFRLQPYDEVHVNKDPAFKNNGNVTINGEVMAEGSYGIVNGVTRVSEILSKAGGLTSQAASNGTYIMRKVSEQDKRRRQRLLDETRATRAYTMANAQSTNSDKAYFADSLLIEQRMRDDYYKVAVDLPASLKNPGSVDDIVLRDGDKIIVEEFNNTVRIMGAVPNENAVPYVKGKNIKYYMGQGGSRGYKDRKWAFIIYQNGITKMIKDGAKVEPGCTIFLPERNTTDNSAKTTMWISVGSTIATMAAVVVSVFK